MCQFTLFVLFCWQYLDNVFHAGRTRQMAWFDSFWNLVTPRLFACIHHSACTSPWKCNVNVLVECFHTSFRSGWTQHIFYSHRFHSITAYGKQTCCLFETAFYNNTHYLRLCVSVFTMPENDWRKRSFLYWMSSIAFCRSANSNDPNLSNHLTFIRHINLSLHWIGVRVWNAKFLLKCTAESKMMRTYWLKLGVTDSWMMKLRRCFFSQFYILL